MKAVDTNVIIHGRGLNGELITVPEVLNELKSREASTSAHGFQIDTFTPSKQSIEKVDEKAEEINSKASEVDRKLLALSMEKNITLMTDDKELQNLGLHLEVDVEGFMDPVTDEKLSWKMKCPICGSEKSCNCGASQVRRLDRRSSV